MENILVIIVFILGFNLICKGADFLVDSAVKLAYKAKISPAIVGATICAIATTFPETTVALISSGTGNAGLGLNTAIGAMVCNFCIVLGLSFIVFSCEIQPSSFLSKSLYFLACVFLLFIFSINGIISKTEAIILFILFVLFVVYNIFSSAKHNTLQTNVVVTMGYTQIIIKFLLASLSVGLGAIALVNNVEAIAKILKINGGLVGTIIIGVGTNIPELITTFSAIKQKSPELGIGNIFGASIINCTMLISVATFVSKTKCIFVNSTLILVSFICLVAICAVIVLPITKYKRTFRWQGFMLAVLYIIYLIFVVKTG